MTTETTRIEEAVEASVSRRRFLGYAGALAGAGMLATVASCKKDDDSTPSGTVDLGSEDFGVLNFAYALEQLEAAFYVKVVASPYIGITADETSKLTDIRDHEVAHREFFKNALGANAIPALEVDFSSIDFSNRTSVLSTAKAFEDLGVSAYNGAGKLIKSATYLGLAGKIVSVEARHAATIRDLITNGSFAASDVVDDTTGLDVVNTPAAVYATAKTYIKTPLDLSHLPTV